MAEDKVMEPVDEGMAVVPDAPLADVPTIIPELEGTVSQLATDVSFARKTWKDGSSGGTPITAAELNRLEKGVGDLTNAVNGLRDSVSQLPAKGFQSKECRGDDFDQLKEFFGSIYQRTPWTSEQHGPVGLNQYGFLFSFGNPAYDVFIQIYFSDFSQVAYRSKYSGSTWKEWKSFA